VRVNRTPRVFTAVENFVAMHGRRTFSGTRKVLASLVAAA
jgi:hypothetical protein